MESSTGSRPNALSSNRTARVVLRILDTTFEILGPRRWTELVEEFFRYFLADPGSLSDLSVTIEDTTSGFTIDYGKGETFSSPSAWTTLLRLRVVLGREAMDRATGLIGLHGALVSLGERSVVLAGSGGAGKTTLAAHLANAGWSFGGDDLLALRTRDQKLIPIPLPPAFKEPEVWRDMSSGWQNPGWLPEPDGAFCLPTSAIDCEVIFSPVAASALAVLQRPSEKNLASLSVAEGVVLLAGEGDHLTPERLRTIVSTVSQMRLFKLRYSTLEDARELLERSDLWI